MQDRQDALKAGTILEGYRIERVLGSGGFATPTSFRCCAFSTRTAAAIWSAAVGGSGGVPAARGGRRDIRAGDVIVEIDRTKITKPAEVADLVKKAEQGRKTSVFLFVQRGHHERFVALRIDEAARRAAE
jgi:hypothetical protein